MKAIVIIGRALLAVAAFASYAWGTDQAITVKNGDNMAIKFLAMSMKCRPMPSLPGWPKAVSIMDYMNISYSNPPRMQPRIRHKVFSFLHPDSGQRLVAVTSSSPEYEGSQMDIYWLTPMGPEFVEGLMLDKNKKEIGQVSNGHAIAPLSRATEIFCHIKYCTTEAKKHQQNERVQQICR